MSTTFSRTLRSLDAERPRRWLPAILVGALLVVWAVWFLLARVTVVEVSDNARLEVLAAAHPVAAPVAGQVMRTFLTLGDEVSQGQELVVLDAESERRLLTEKIASRDALGARLQSLADQIQVEQQAIELQPRARALALEESQALVVEAEARTRWAERRAKTSANLESRGAMAKEELERNQVEAEARRAGVNALALSASRLNQDRAIQETDRSSRLAELRCEQVELTGDQAIEEAAIQRLEYEISLRTIRAPVAGRVGEVSEFRVGSVVRAAEKLGTIVPNGQPCAVAMFPAAAVGRLRPEQPARLRMKRFPWTQYGTLQASVAHVGNEARDGWVRVELALAPAPYSAIPIQHGLAGSVEVQVDRVSPAVLVLRAAGLFLAARPADADERE